MARFPDIMGIPGTAALCALPSVLNSNIRTLAVEGPLAPDTADAGAWLSAELLGQGIADGGWRAVDAPRLLVRPMDIPDHCAGALLLLAEEDIPADRRHLADVYAASLGVWLRNVSLQDSLRRHQSTLEQQVADRTAELTP